MEQISEQDIIDIMEHLGSPSFKNAKNSLIFSTHVCHGGNKYKLYYFKDSKRFYCYTDCNKNYGLYDLIQKNKDLTFKESVEWVSDYTNIYPELNNRIELIDDWAWLNKYKRNKYKIVSDFNKERNESELNIYFKYPHKDLSKEGISHLTQKKFNIMYDLSSDRIIFPAYDKEGRLIGAKGRIINELEGENDALESRYIGVIPYNKSHILWGLQNTYPYIQEEDKLIIFESEKSVMKAWDFGYPHCCAIGGHNISSEQIKQSISLASEIIIAFDKDVGGDIYKDIIDKLGSFCRLSIIWDKQNMLDEKDSPVDKSLDVFTKLYNSRYKIT